MKCFIVKTKATIYNSAGDIIIAKRISDILVREELVLDTVLLANIETEFGKQHLYKKLSHIPFNLVDLVKKDGGYLFRRLGKRTDKTYYMYVPLNFVTVV